MRAKPLVYFGTPDRQMEPFLNEDELLRSLVYGVLFQGDLVIPDSLFYLSERFAYLIRGPATMPFIRSAVRNGAIIPAFRRPAECFRDNLRHIEDNRVSGILNQADELAGILDGAIRGVRLNPRIWPEQSVSVGFREMLQRCLLDESLVSQSPSLQEFFESTREMRSVVIQGTKSDPVGGIQRGALNAALGSYLRLGVGTVHNIATIGAHV